MTSTANTASSDQFELATPSASTFSTSNTPTSPQLSLPQLSIYESLLSRPVYLNGPTSWDAWFTSIKRLAEAEGVEELIRPSRYFRYLDDNKELDEFFDEIYCDDFWDSELLHLPKQLPRPRDVRKDARSAADLTPVESYRYWNLHRDYATCKARWEKADKAVEKIYEHVLKTVHERYIPYMQDSDSLSDLLQNLKLRVAPSKCAKQCRALHAYRQTLEMITAADFMEEVLTAEEIVIANKNAKKAAEDATATVDGGVSIPGTALSKLENWHENYQCALYTCKRLDVPEVKGVEGLREFLPAIGAIIPDLAAEYIKEIEARQLDGGELPNLRTVAKTFFERLWVGLTC